MFARNHFVQSYKRKYYNMFWKQYLIAAIGFGIFVLAIIF